MECWSIQHLVCCLRAQTKPYMDTACLSSSRARRKLPLGWALQCLWPLGREQCPLLAVYTGSDGQIAESKLPRGYVSSLQNQRHRKANDVNDDIIYQHLMANSRAWQLLSHTLMVVPGLEGEHLFKEGILSGWNTAWYCTLFAQPHSFTGHVARPILQSSANPKHMVGQSAISSMSQKSIRSTMMMICVNLVLLRSIRRTSTSIRESSNRLSPTPRGDDRFRPRGLEAGPARPRNPRSNCQPNDRHKL